MWWIDVACRLKVYPGEGDLVVQGCGVLESEPLILSAQRGPTASRDWPLRILRELVVPVGSYYSRWMFIFSIILSRLRWPGSWSFFYGDIPQHGYLREIRRVCRALCSICQQGRNPDSSFLLRFFTLLFLMFYACNVEVHAVCFQSQIPRWFVSISDSCCGLGHTVCFETWTPLHWNDTK